MSASINSTFSLVFMANAMARLTENVLLPSPGTEEETTMIFLFSSFSPRSMMLVRMVRTASANTD